MYKVIGHEPVVGKDGKIVWRPIKQDLGPVDARRHIGRANALSGNEIEKEDENDRLS